MTGRGRRLAPLVMIGLLVACSGGAGDGVADDGTTTTAPPELVETPTAFRATGRLETAGADLTFSSDVVDPEHYRYRIEVNDSTTDVVRVGDAVFTRVGADPESLEATGYVEEPAAEATATGQLDEAAGSDTGATDVAGTAGIDLLTSVALELLLTDPDAIVDLDALPVAETDRIDLPPTLRDQLAALDVDPPELQARVDGEDGALGAIGLRLREGDAVADFTVTYADLGAVTDDQVAAPPEDQIDQTPWMEEEAVTEFAEAPIVAPSALPGGLVLVGAKVLDVGETREGCTQVELDYDTEPVDRPDRPLVVFVLGQTCSVGFDAAPFDEVLGGFPARGGGYEVLVGTSVVQLSTSTLDRAELDALAASLTPVDPTVLLASVVPPAD